MMDIYTAVASRKTIREFSDKVVDMAIVEKIIGAGLQAPSNDHLRTWEFVLVNDMQVRAELLRVPVLDDPQEIGQMLDTRNIKDEIQRKMYFYSMPKQYSMLYTAGCLLLPLFKVKTPLLVPETLSSLNAFASIWCCIENILLAAAAEGIYGVTRIPMKEESAHIQAVLGHPADYVMPCYMALGYPAAHATRTEQKNVSVQEKLHMNRW